MDHEHSKEPVMHVPVAKVIELVLQEERAKIRAHYTNTLGKSYGDNMDTYVPTESEIFKLFI